MRKETLMKQLGNLAIICARRNDLVFLLQYGEVHIEVRNKKESQTLIAAWDDDEAISAIIHELNFGKYAEKT